MLITGDPITAQRALELGMINRVCESKVKFISKINKDNY
jgi:enoyl-CoA hydratase/carnithine racemase